MEMRIITVIGARPQFIKAAALTRCFQQAQDIDEILVHTGQHYDENMSELFFAELDIPRPAYHLGIGSASHGMQTGRMLEQLEKILLAEKPDLVLVYGDTNSTLAGALAASKLHIPVAHVEAGLRSFNRKMPEEVNRVLTDHLSRWLFAPTHVAVDNLKREGIPSHLIYFVGDVMYDAVEHFGHYDRVQILQRLGVRPCQYILATIHRAENTDSLTRLYSIMTGLQKIAADYPVVFPLHPRTRVVLEREGLLGNLSGVIRFIEPVGYFDMLALERNARLVATDSGGVQKEAFFCRVPCVTLREETEWIELVQCGWNQLISPNDAMAIYQGIQKCLAITERPIPPSDLYGGGQACQRIVQILRTAA